MENKNCALVIFNKNISVRDMPKDTFSEVVAPMELRNEVEKLGSRFVKLEEWVDAGNIREAGAMLEGLPKLKFSDGTLISKSFPYDGYELWWANYNSFFYHFCIPYTQYKRLLDYLKKFDTVFFYEPPHKSLFFYYLDSHGSHADLFVGEKKQNRIFTIGIITQLLLTAISIPILIIRRSKVLVFTGDKIEITKDYDARMRFIYEGLRNRGLAFVEFVRSFESSNKIIKNVLVRKRPVIYTESITALGKIISRISLGRRRLRQRVASQMSVGTSSDEKFKFLIAVHYLWGVCDDVWSIRIMKLILKMIGTKVAIVTAMQERNFQTIVACKINKIPTIGILHGMSFRYSTAYDYMTGFDGPKTLAVDKYGVWSEWWKNHFIEESDIYKAEQLFVSGPMRPLVPKLTGHENKSESTMSDQQIRVLFIAEQAAAPREVMPYLRELLNRQDIQLTIKFRPAGDRFFVWLSENEPDILKTPGLLVDKNSMQEAVGNNDVVVGCLSTGVLEALLQSKVPIFFRTNKWGDYYEMSKTSEHRVLFAENPKELVVRIRSSYSISKEMLMQLREQYFGDPYKNGSDWVVEQASHILMGDKLC